MTGEELDRLYLRALEGVVQPRDLLLVIDRLREALKREQNLRELLAASERRKGGGE